MIRSFVLLLVLALPLAAVGQDVEDVSLEANRAATVRVRSGNSVGTGTFFLKRENGNYCVLTNSHVAGRKGGQVSLQMWYKGYLSKPVTGTVTFSIMARNYYRDVAVIEVPENAFGDYRPPVIPLAPKEYESDFTRLYSFGCGAGSWLTNWEGHAFRQESQSGDVINFFPQPAGGRSGSAIFSADGKYIIALIAWRSMGGQHSLDGSGESSSQYGIAMTKDEVWAAFSGTAPTSYVPVELNPLELPDYEDLKNEPVSTEVPAIFQESPSNCLPPEAHGSVELLQGRTLRYTLNPEEIQEASTIQELFPNFPRRQERRFEPPSPEPGPDDGGDEFLFDLPPNLKPAPKPESDPLPQIDPESPKLPEQPNTPESNPDNPKPDNPEPDVPEQEQSEPPVPPWTTQDWMWLILNLVMWAAALTGIFVWIRGPLVSAATSFAVAAAPEKVKAKLDKREGV